MTTIAKFTRALVVLGGLSCGLRGAGQPTETCDRTDRGVDRFDPYRLSALAGDYRVVLVDTASPWHATRIYEPLHLEVADSAHRYEFVKPQLGRLPGERPLIGWAVSQDTLGARHERLPVTYGARFQRLFIGNVDITDGASDDLEIQYQTGRGFGGRWTANMGIAISVDSTGKELPAPAGYFCAVRRAGA